MARTLKKNENAPPTVGVSIIVRNKGRTIKSTLESCLPYVDEVVVVFAGKSTDDTEKIVRSMKKLWGNLKIFSTEWTDSFADARNFAYSKVTTDWVLFLDGDDVLYGGDKLRSLAFLGEKTENLDGFVMPYVYAKDQNDKPIMQQMKDRFHKRSIFTKEGAKWKYRVHEIIDMDRKKSYAETMSLEEGLFVDHLLSNDPDEVDARNRRNLRLLRLSLKDKDAYVDPRNWIEMGRHWKNTGIQTVGRAVPYLRHALQMPNLIENEDRYMAYKVLGDCYRDISYRKMNDPKYLQLAIEAYTAATAIMPDVREAYIGLADCNLRLQNKEKAKTYIEIQMNMKNWDARVGVNPMDYTFEVERILSGIALLYEDYPAALQHCNNALSYVPDHETMNKLKGALEGFFIQEQVIGSFLLLSNLKSSSVFNIYLGMPIEYRYRPIRDKIFGNDVTDTPENIIYTGPGVEEWYPEKMYNEGLGGSEIAVIQYVQESSPTWFVNYGNPGNYESEIHREWDRFDPSKEYKNFISWRMPDLVSKLEVKAKNKILWCHDLNYEDKISVFGKDYDYIAAVSDWHAGYLKSLYPELAEKVIVFANGIDSREYKGSGERDKHNYIFASSPDRGLHFTLDLWKRMLEFGVVKADEDKLHIYYGFHHMEKFGINPEYVTLMKRYIRVLPGVEYHGRVGHEELMEAFSTANMLLYPTDFVETYCINVVEAQSVGCIPVTSNLGALTQNVFSDELKIPGRPGTIPYIKKFLSTVHYLNENPESTEELRSKIAEKAKEKTWYAAIDKAQEYFVGGDGA